MESIEKSIEEPIEDPIEDPEPIVESIEKSIKEPIEEPDIKSDIKQNVLSNIKSDMNTYDTDLNSLINIPPVFPVLVFIIEYLKDNKIDFAQIKERYNKNKEVEHIICLCKMMKKNSFIANEQLEQIDNIIAFYFVLSYITNEKIDENI